MLRDYRKFILAMGLLCCVVTASAVGKWDFKIDGIYYKILSFDDLTVAVANSSSNPDPSKYSAESYKGDVVIPTTVNDSYGKSYTVVKINKYAFHSCSSLTSVVIPETITAIDDEVFVGNTSMTALDIPSTVATIGSNNFADCGLKMVEVWNRNIDMTFLSTMPMGATVCVHSSVHNQAKEIFSGTTNMLEDMYAEISENSNTGISQIGLNVKMLNADASIGDIYLVKDDGSHVKDADRIFPNLIMDTEYDIVAECNLYNRRIEELYYKVSTSEPKVSVNFVSRDWKSISIRFICETADSQPQAVKMGFAGKETTNSTMVISELLPGECVTGTPYAEYSNGKTYYGAETSQSTLEAKIELDKVSTDKYNTMVIEATEYLGLLTVEERGFLSSETANDFSGSKTIELTGLRVGDELTLVYGAKTKEQGVITTSATFSFKPDWYEDEQTPLSDSEARIWIKTNYTDAVFGNGIRYWEEGAEEFTEMEVPTMQENRMCFKLTDLKVGGNYIYQAYHKVGTKIYRSQWFKYTHTDDYGSNDLSYGTPLAVEVEGTTAKLTGYEVLGNVSPNRIGFSLQEENNDETFVEADTYSDGWVKATATDLKPNTTYKAFMRVYYGSASYSTSHQHIEFTTGASSAIDDIATDSEGIDGECVITSISGVVVASGKLWSEVKEGLNAGIYIVTIGNETIKVVI